MSHPIAYTYEASEHCPPCAERRFGRNAHGFIAEECFDSERNPVGAVFSWDAFEHRDMVCGTCHTVIHEIDKTEKPGDQCAKCHHSRAVHKAGLHVPNYATDCCVYCGPNFCPAFLEYQKNAS